ncbi:type VII secretion-associated serine protease mycosin [Streptomyces antimicrobicus]|uniref:Type VII secretion-associated serine protease mycosin n=1 Tax=Streptomyces antimicrobicus TaxID=2883108 RepID=A0ABS8BAX6_9ACTN|nr:type VII secretion-associated serine protease mycosin [Streptomyces antimicrobicus]MCB5181782.1 type VII secretion-associated serine protease mycosin [Streptomyces antimicrobicus]
MRMRKATSALVGLLLAGVAATPAHAETIRSKQWHLDSMQAEQMWKASNGAGITVAVIDTGVADVPELKGQVLPGKDLAIGYEGDWRTDYEKHGTTMAAIIAGSGKGPGGADGAYGLAPGAKILPVRVSLGGPQQRPNQSMSEGIRFAADSDAKILNISMASAGTSPELDEAVKYALSKGKLVFAGVGNDGETSNQTKYPAATPGVVGVAAIDRQANATKESQHGPWVDVAAPGADIVTACGGKTGLCNSHGTSDATALASASAALLWSAHPDWTNNQVLRVLLNTAGKPRDGVARNDYIGYGVVRPRIALTNPGDPGSATEWPLPDLAAAPGGAKSPSGEAGKPGSGASAAPAPAAAQGSDGLPWTWIGLGLGACVLIGGAVTAVVVRRQNR